MVAENWLDWVTVLGYLSFTLFVIWRIFASPR